MLFDKNARDKIHQELTNDPREDFAVFLSYIVLLEEVARKAQALWEEHPGNYPRSEADKNLYVALAKVDWMRE